MLIRLLQEPAISSVPRCRAFPTSLREFQRRFADEKACQQYLEACRWPEGFRCPRCGHGRAFPIRAWQRRECARCRYQVSPDRGHGPASDQAPVDGGVLGGLIDDDRQARDLGAAASTPAGDRSVRDRLAPAAQAPPCDGERGARTVAWGRRTRRHLGRRSATGAAWQPPIQRSQSGSGRRLGGEAGSRHRARPHGGDS